MNVPSIRRLYAFNRWANDRTLSSVADLTGEEFTRKFSVSFGSIQGTLVHILGVEWLYLQRWRGIFPTQLFACREVILKSDGAERYNNAYILQMFQFVEQVRPTIDVFGRQRLVIGRGAVNGRRDIAVAQFETVTAIDRLRLIGETGLV